MSSVFDAIKRIKHEELESFYYMDPDILHCYSIGYDGIQRVAYVTARIYSNNLDTGTAPSSEAISWVRAAGWGDDQPDYIIPKKLGGPGTVSNVFPLWPKIKDGKWSRDEEAVYQYLQASEHERHATRPQDEEWDNDEKKAHRQLPGWSQEGRSGMLTRLQHEEWKEDKEMMSHNQHPVGSKEDRYAILTFATEFEDPFKLHRPSKIYYRFELYDENHNISGTEMVGEMENISPVPKKPQEQGTSC